MDVHEALADPVRRSILVALNQRPLTAGAVASRFAISRPAVSRHLRVLREAGLVSVQEEGRTRVYRLEPAPLNALVTWLDQFHDPWTSRIDALETEIHRTKRARIRREHALNEEEQSA